MCPQIVCHGDKELEKKGVTLRRDLGLQLTVCVGSGRETRLAGTGTRTGTGTGASSPSPELLSQVAKRPSRRFNPPHPAAGVPK